MKIKNLKYYLIFIFAEIIFAQTQTTEVFPLGPNGGIISAVEGSANDENIIASVKGNGIYFSKDAGETWTQSSLKNVNVNQFAAHATNPLIFFAATDSGVYFSNDGGKIWSRTNLIASTRAIITHPKNTNLIVAGVYSSDTISNGVWQSTNNGQVWKRIDSTLSEKNKITALASDAKNDSTIFVGTDGNGFFSTYDFGKNWSADNVGLGAKNSPSNFIQTILHYYDPVFKYNAITVGTAVGIYSSQNFSGSPLNWINLRTISGIEDSVITSLKASFYSPPLGAIDRYYFVSTRQSLPNRIPNDIKGGLFRVDVLNQSWSLVFKKNIDVNSIFIPKSKQNKVYIASSDGIFISSEYGINFIKKSLGINHSIVKSISITNENQPIIFSGIYGGGVQRSLDSGKTWEYANNGLGNPYVYAVAVDSQNSGLIYASTVRGIYSSSNFGNTWTYQNIPIEFPEKYNSTNIGAFRIGKNNTSNLIFTSPAHGLNLSSNKGTKWNKINFQNSSQISSANVVDNLDFGAKNDSSIIGTGNGIWKSKDFGTTWQNISGNFPLTVNDLGVTKSLFAFRPHEDPKNDSVIYISTTTNLSNYSPYKLFKTTDGGKIWKELSIATYDISIDYRKPRVIFASGKNNIYHTLNSGESWTTLTKANLLPTFRNLTPLPTNLNLHFIASSTGIHTIEFSSEPDLNFNQYIVDFSSQLIGSTISKQILFTNQGGVELNVKIDSVSGSKNFTISANSIKVASRKAGFLTATYKPLNATIENLILYCTTNDPTKENLTITLTGIGVANSISKKRILIDSLHGLNSSGGNFETQKYFSSLISILKSSSFEVISNQTKFSPSNFDIVLLGTPSRAYATNEIDSLQKYIYKGGLVVMLADSGAKNGNKFLNDILSDSRWKTNFNDSTDLLITSKIIIDSANGLLRRKTWAKIGGKNFPNHPYFFKIDSLVFSGAVSIETKDSSNKLLVGNHSTRLLNNSIVEDDSTYPTLVALSNIGKGKILLIGDCDIFSNGESFNDSLNRNVKTGIAAGANLQFALNIFTHKNDFAVQYPRKTPNEQYIAFSIPFDLDNFSIGTALKDLGVIDPSRWRLYKWNVKTGKYIEFPNLEFLNFNRGDGYWLITKGERTLNFGNAQIQSTTEFYPITLQPGYNLIGNPFPYKISWALSNKNTKIEKKIWWWSSTKFVSDTNFMEPFTAYYIKNNSLLPEIIKINPMAISASGGAKSTFSQKTFGKNEWKIQISANSIFANDDENYLGMISDAKTEWDKNDFSEPPVSPTNSLSLYFDKQNWADNKGKFSTDFRPISNDGEFWDFKIFASRTNEEMNLQFSIDGNFASDNKIFLVDLITERVIDVSSNGNSYFFKTKKGENERNFRLIVGSKNYAEQNSFGIPLVPIQYKLEQNFPNPFNGSTKISYTLSHSANVKIYIYNLLGQIVKIIDDGFHPIGKYTVAWNGKNNIGEIVASGIYFYKISTEEFVAQKKMIYLK